MFWKQMYDAFNSPVDAMHQFNVSNTKYRNHIKAISFQPISDEITPWWDEFQFLMQGQYPIPIQGRFQIYYLG